MRFVDDSQLSPLSNGSLLEDMQFWVRQILEQKELEKVSQKTLKSYSNALDSFLEFVSKYSDSNLMDNIGAKFINRYLIEYQAQLALKKIEKLKKKNIPGELEKYQRIINQKDEKFLGKNDASFEILDEFQNTLKHRLTVVKILLKYISYNNEEEHDYTAMFRKLVTIKIKEQFTQYITVDEMDSVISLMTIWPDVYKEYKLKSSLRSAYRESLLILIYALTGARSEEVVKIKLSDISLFKHNNRTYYSIKIQEGKGDKIREIGIDAGFIEKHIEYFKNNLPHKDCYISSTYSKGTYKNYPQHPNNIRTFGNFVLRILGINKSGLHTFRRGYATKRINEDGVNIALVAKEMGNSINVLEKYYLKHNAVMSVVS